MAPPFQMSLRTREIDAYFCLDTGLAKWPTERIPGAATPATGEEPGSQALSP